MMFFRYFIGAQPEWDNMVNRPFMRAPDTMNVNYSNASMSTLWSEQLMKMLMKPQNSNNTTTSISPVVQETFAANRNQLLQVENRPQFNLIQPSTSNVTSNSSPQSNANLSGNGNQQPQQKPANQTLVSSTSETVKSKSKPINSP